MTSEQKDDAAQHRARTTALVTLAGAVIAAALSFTTFLFTIFPEWRPDPRERSDASITVLALDRNVSHGEYFRRVDRKVTCTVAQLSRDGNVVYLQVDAAGFKSSSIELRWFTYNAGNGRRLRNDDLRSSDDETTVFEPRAPINRQVAAVWVPTALPDADTSYFIRFELYSKDVLRAFVDTTPFSVPARLPGEVAPDLCSERRSRT
jgi:hypothetical protein